MNTLIEEIMCLKYNTIPFKFRLWLWTIEAFKEMMSIGYNQIYFWRFTNIVDQII